MHSMFVILRTLIVIIMVKTELKQNRNNEMAAVPEETNRQEEVWPANTK